jgi:small GTP-binding protein
MPPPLTKFIINLYCTKHGDVESVAM